IEAEGIRRALARAEAADLKVALFDAATLPLLDTNTLALVDANTLVVLSRADLASAPLPDRIGGNPAIAISLKANHGVSALLDALGSAVESRLTAGGDATLTRARHRHAVETALLSLERGVSAPLPEL